MISRGCTEEAEVASAGGTSDWDERGKKVRSTETRKASRLKYFIQSLQPFGPGMLDLAAPLIQTPETKNRCGADSHSPCLRLTGVSGEFFTVIRI